MNKITSQVIIGLAMFKVALLVVASIVVGSVFSDM
jgi:hypothetical protein